MIRDLRVIRGAGGVRKVRSVRDHDFAHHTRIALQGQVLRRLEVDDPRALHFRTGVTRRIRRGDGHPVRALLHRTRILGRFIVRHRHAVELPVERHRRQVIRSRLEIECRRRSHLVLRRFAVDRKILRHRVVVGLPHRRLGRWVRIAGHVREHALRHDNRDQRLLGRRHFQRIDLLRNHAIVTLLLVGLLELRDHTVGNDDRLLRQFRHALARHADRDLERGKRRVEVVRRLARQRDNRALRVVDARERRLLVLLVPRRLVAVARVIPHLVRVN